MISGCSVGSSAAKPLTLAAGWPPYAEPAAFSGDVSPEVVAGRATVTIGAGAGGAAGEGPKVCHRKRISRMSITPPSPAAKYVFFLSSLPTLIAISALPPLTALHPPA